MFLATYEYALYTKLRHSRGHDQLMGVARKRTRAQALQTSSCVTCVAYVETGTNS